MRWLFGSHRRIYGWAKSAGIWIRECLDLEPDASHGHRVRPKSSRPCLEACEERLTPAVIVWTYTGSGAGDWDDANNWTISGGGHQVPGSNDYAYFYGSQTSANCYIANQVSVKGLTLSDGYTGTLMVEQGLDIGISGLQMETGSIRQANGSSSKITLLSGASNWTGGTLNGSSTLSSIQINASAYLFIDGTPGNIGSTLEIAGTVQVGPNLTSAPSFTNNAGINNAGLLRFEYASNLARATGGTGYINNTGSIEKISSATTTLALPIVNTGSSAELVVEEGTLQITQQHSTNNVSVFQSGGRTHLAGEAILDVTYGYTQYGGALETSASTGGNTGRIATGNVVIHGGYVEIGTTTSADHTLRIDGNFTMDDGVLYLTIQGGTTPSSERLSVGGSVTIGSDARLDVDHYFGFPAHLAFLTIIESDQSSITISNDFTSELFFTQGSYTGQLGGNNDVYFLQWHES